MENNTLEIRKKNPQIIVARSFFSLLLPKTLRKTSALIVAGETYKLMKELENYNVNIAETGALFSRMTHGEMKMKRKQE